MCKWKNPLASEHLLKYTNEKIKKTTQNDSTPFSLVSVPIADNRGAMPWVYEDQIHKYLRGMQKNEEKERVISFKRPKMTAKANWAKNK